MTRWPPLLKNAQSAVPMSPDDPVTATVSGRSRSPAIFRCAARSAASWLCRYRNICVRRDPGTGVSTPSVSRVLELVTASKLCVWRHRSGNETSSSTNRCGGS